MKSLLTGAAGFIGFHVSTRLLARGDEVIGLDNIKDYYDPTLKEARLERLRKSPAFRYSRERADSGRSRAKCFAERWRTLGALVRVIASQR